MSIKRHVTPIYIGSESIDNTTDKKASSVNKIETKQTSSEINECEENVSNPLAGQNQDALHKEEIKEAKIPKIDEQTASQPTFSLGMIGRGKDPGIGRRKPSPITDIPPECLPAQSPEDDKDEEAYQEAACDTSIFDKLQQVIMPLLWLVTALLGCFITKNIADFYVTVRSMSVFAIILFSIPMMLCSGILIFMLYKLARLMIQLQTFTQISGNALAELRNREELRAQCAKHEEEACRRLKELLQEDNTEQEKMFVSIGKREEMVELQEAKEVLLECHCTVVEWFDKYLHEYQNKLDEVAEDVIKRYSWKAAIAATASPFAALDQVIVLATCVTMLKDLFLIYNLKPTWDKNMLLMSRIVIHVYVTGFWQDFSKAGVDTLHKGLDSFIDNVKNTNTEGIMAKAGAGMGSLLGGNLGQIVAKGVGECVMHKITVSRLGAAAIRMLRPVKI